MRGNINAVSEGAVQILNIMYNINNEPRHDKINKVSVRPVKAKISLGIRPV